jgi:hypothetical protein
LQNPGRRVFTPDVNNKPQANPKVLMFFPFPHKEFDCILNIIMLKFPPLMALFTSIFLHKKLYSSNYAGIENTNKWLNVLI